MIYNNRKWHKNCTRDSTCCQFWVTGGEVVVGFRGGGFISVHCGNQRSKNQKQWNIEVIVELERDKRWKQESGWQWKLWCWWCWVGVACGKVAMVWVCVKWMKRDWKHASPQWLNQTQLIHHLNAAKPSLVLTWNASALTRTLQRYLFLELTQLLPLYFLQSAISLLRIIAELIPFSLFLRLIIIFSPHHQERKRKIMVLFFFSFFFGLQYYKMCSSFWLCTLWVLWVCEFKSLRFDSQRKIYSFQLSTKI